MLAATAALTLPACASTLPGTGHGSGSPLPSTSALQSTAAPTTAAPTTSAPTTSAAPSSASASTASSAPAAPTSASPVAPVTGAATPCPHSQAQDAFSCLQGVLSNYWSGQLNQVVTEPIVVDASPAQVPPACRPGIEAGAAITCRSDLTLYISHAFLAKIDSSFTGLDRALAYASVASHEFGHVLQYTLHQPQIEQKHPTDATSQYVEQQADCLSGVWAGATASHHDLDANAFLADAEKLIMLVSTNPEIATHGTPLTRRAAIARGIAGGSAGVCNLATFH
jgi:uncharacterized protein